MTDSTPHTTKPAPGPLNLITDVKGLKVGNAQDEKLRSGVTVLLPDSPVTACVDMRGGGPGTREASTLNLDTTVSEIHALVLSGGSAFGLDAASAVQNHLRQQGRGFEVGAPNGPKAHVPIVPQAILFDLLNGGDKTWNERSPYYDLANQACTKCKREFELGNNGAGMGALSANLKGGLGSASVITPSGVTIGALAAANPVGSVTIGNSRHFWAAPFEMNNEFGGQGWPSAFPPMDKLHLVKGAPHPQEKSNTTLIVVATDAALSPAQTKRLAIMAHTGMARAIFPVHTPLDGDIVFALSTGQKQLNNPVSDLAELGSYAAQCTARAIARGVYLASSFPNSATVNQAYQDRFPPGAP